MRFISCTCPYCGGFFQLPEGKGAAFCAHCGRQILADQYDLRTKMDVVGTSCGRCGNAIGIGTSYRCSECGVDGLCRNCVADANGVFVCHECTRKKWEPYHKPEPSNKPTSNNHVCPTCGQPLRYIQPYQRWWCDNEKKYL